MIDKLIYTVKSFEVYHKLLWNSIITRVKAMECELDKNLLENVKRDAYHSLFSSEVKHLCFGCGWARFNHGMACRFCLFDFKPEMTCLNGVWDSYLESKTKKEAIKHARIIRNFPTNKQWLKGD